MSAVVTPQLLVGRTIVAVDLRSWVDEAEGTCYDPVFTLDNGARVRFVVQETEADDRYGILPIYDSARDPR